MGRSERGRTGVHEPSFSRLRPVAVAKRTGDTAVAGRPPGLLSASSHSPTGNFCRYKASFDCPLPLLATRFLTYACDAAGGAAATPVPLSPTTLRRPCTQPARTVDQPLRSPARSTVKVITMSPTPNSSRPRQIPATHFYEPPPPLRPQPSAQYAPPPSAPAPILIRQPSRPTRQPSPATTVSASATNSSARHTAISSHSSEAGWLPAGALPGGPPPLTYSVQMPRAVGVIEEHPGENDGEWEGERHDGRGLVPGYEGHWRDQPSVSAYSVQLESRVAPAPPMPVPGEQGHSQGSYAAFGLDRKPTLSAPQSGPRAPPPLGQADRAGNRLQALQMPLAPPPRAVLVAPPAAAAAAAADSPATKFGDSPASAASQRPTPHRVGSMDWSRFSVMMRKTKAEEYDQKFADKDTTWLAPKAAKERTCKRWAVFAGFLALCVLAGLLCWHFLTKDGTTEPRTLGGSKDGSASSTAGSAGSGSGSATSSTTEGLGIHWNYVETSAGVASASATAAPARMGRRGAKHRRLGKRGV